MITFGYILSSTCDDRHAWVSIMKAKILLAVLAVPALAQAKTTHCSGPDATFELQTQGEKIVAVSMDAKQYTGSLDLTGATLMNSAGMLQVIIEKTEQQPGLMLEIMGQMSFANVNDEHMSLHCK